MDAAARRRAFGWLAVLLPPALFLTVYAVHAPGEPAFNPDSQSYLDFAAFRSGGYPLFLTVLKPLVSDVSGYAAAQRIGYAIAVLLLTRQLLLLLGSPLVAGFAALALLFNPEVNRYHFIVVTESLFLSVTALFFAAAFSHIRTRSLASIAAASAAVGVLIAIRPTGLAFVPALALLALVGRFGAARGSRLAWLTALAVPVVAVMALEHAWYSARHSGPRQSLADTHFVAKVGMAGNSSRPAPGISPDAARLFARLDADLAEARRTVAEAPNLPTHCVLGAAYENHLQYQYQPQERLAFNAPDRRRRLARDALAQLWADPSAMLGLAARHWLCLWSLGAASAAERGDMERYVHDRRPLPYDASVQPAIAGTRLPPFGSAARWVMGMAAALSAAAVIALCLQLASFRRPDALLAAAGLAGLATHAAFALTALTGIGIPRYALGFWVPLTLGVGLSALWLAGLLAPRWFRAANMRAVP